MLVFSLSLISCTILIPSIALSLSFSFIIYEHDGESESDGVNVSMIFLVLKFKDPLCSLISSSFKTKGKQKLGSKHQGQGIVCYKKTHINNSSS